MLSLFPNFPVHSLSATIMLKIECLLWNNVQLITMEIISIHTKLTVGMKERIWWKVLRDSLGCSTTKLNLHFSFNQINLYNFLFNLDLLLRLNLFFHDHINFILRNKKYYTNTYQTTFPQRVERNQIGPYIISFILLCIMVYRGFELIQILTYLLQNPPNWYIIIIHAWK